VTKVLLMILDGWGIGRGDKADVIGTVRPPFMAKLTHDCPHATLRTDGLAVGLPEGQMGNSEVGHLNIGAGRVLYQDLVKINRAVEDGSLARVPGVAKMLESAKKSGRLHVLGLLSDGGVHASLEHILAIVRLAREAGVENVFLHAFMDGRDTDPKSGIGFVRETVDALKASGAHFATMTGRYWAMDRDKRWERIREAYGALVLGEGVKAEDPVAALQGSYDEGVTDEFVKPVVMTTTDGRPVGTIREGDTVVFCNFRNDRAKELTIALTQRDVDEAGMKRLSLDYYTMTPYDPTFAGLTVLFPKDEVKNTIGEYVSSLGLTQLRIAETEKYAHVTFFLNGGREAPFEGEDRILVNSPKVATYDLQPAMSAPEVTECLVGNIREKAPDLIVLNFANGDMVGHTGVYDAIVEAVKTVDACVEKVVTAARAAGYDVVICADHGNADNAVNADGSPNTAHSLNPVPMIVVSDRVKSVRDGVLADVAPTVLDLMGLEKPAEMTGTSLVEKA
jgi:2,3-bisphosphoglycerate-independent phosphoglycerate mutase